MKKFKGVCHHGLHTTEHVMENFFLSVSFYISSTLR